MTRIIVVTTLAAAGITGYQYLWLDDEIWLEVVVVVVVVVVVTAWLDNTDWD